MLFNVLVSFGQRIIENGHNVVGMLPVGEECNGLEDEMSGESKRSLRYCLTRTLLVQMEESRHPTINSEVKGTNVNMLHESIADMLRSLSLAEEACSEIQTK